MRYMMKEKILSIGDDYTIQDENGNDKYFVDGKVLTLSNKLSFQDLDGRELALIKQRLISWKKTFDIYRDGNLVAVIKKNRFKFLHDRHVIDVPGPNDYDITGNLLDHEYSFTRNGETVARVSKKFFSFADKYGIEIADNEDDVLILSAAVVIDLTAHEGRKN